MRDTNDPDVPSQGVPPGYRRDPQTGALVPIEAIGPYHGIDKPPATAPGATGGGPATNPLYAPYNVPYQAPQHLNLGGPQGLSFLPSAPQFNWTPPSPGDALSADPGYQFRFQQGLGAVEQSAAAKGILNTGGTLKNIEDYGQQAGSQEYGNIYDRSFSLAQAKFAPVMSEYNTVAQAGQREDELEQQRAFDLYQQHYKEWLDWNNLDFSRKYQVATA